MPRLDVVVDSLDAVDEAAHGFYRQIDDGDGFVLDLGGIDKHPDVVGLKRHQQRALDEAKKAKRERDELEERFQGIEDPDRAREAIAKYEEWEAKGSLPDEDAIPRELHEKRLEAAKKKGQAEAEKAAQEAERLRAALERKEVVGSLRKAVADAGVLEEYRDDVVRRLMEDGPEVVWDNDDPRGVFRNELGDTVGIEDYVAAFAKSDEADKYMPSSGNKGTGSTSGGAGRTRAGSNPFAKDTKNLSEQMRLVRESPDQARILAAEAGVQLPKLAS